MTAKTMSATTRNKRNTISRCTHIHLALKRGTSLGRGILDGFTAYGGHRTDWRCGIVSSHHSNLGPPYADALLGGVKPRNAEGWDTDQRRMIVNTSRSTNLPDIASVTCDDRQIGRLAAEHLLGKGLTDFAYFGPASNHREQAFRERVKADARSYSTFFKGTDADAEGSLEHWLADLPKCTGIMNFNDGFAVQLIWAAESIGRGIPEDLAVIGVDADDVESLLAPVRITSVDPDFYTVGYRAAELLDRILQGYDARRERIRIAPAGVIERASTDFPGISDRVVIEAARYIRRHACDGIRVADVVAAIPLSRRPLEQRFRDCFGRTLLGEIHRVRIAEASRLLARTDFSLNRIAEESGYNGRTKLTKAFGDNTGMSPSEYRRRYSGGKGG